MRLESLLEQHDRYRLGGGFAVSKRPGGWCIYFRGKHVDCWEAEYHERDIPTEQQLSRYPQCITAVAAAVQLQTSAEWLPTPKELG